MDPKTPFQALCASLVTAAFLRYGPDYKRMAPEVHEFIGHTNGLDIPFAERFWMACNIVHQGRLISKE